MRRIIVAGATLSLGPALLTGCSGGLVQPHSGPGRTPASASVPDDPTGARAAWLAGRPLDAYVLLDDRGAAVSAAQDILARACMVKLGFTWRPTAPIPPPGVYQDNPSATTGYREVSTDLPR